MCAQEIPASRFVELCPGVVVSEKSSCFTHTAYFLNTSLTTFFFSLTTFFFSPLAIHTQYFSCLTVTNKADQTFLNAAPSFPVYVIRGGIESLYMIFS